MSRKWTTEMDGDLRRRRKAGESFAQIAVALKLQKNMIVARAKRLGLDPTDWSTSERFYVMQPVKHSPRKRTSYREKRVQNIVTHTEPEPPAPPPFRSPIQDAWPLTMCNELPLRIDDLYEPVNR